MNRVQHEDREVEFHDLIDEAKQELVNSYRVENGIYQFGEDSCETIARKLSESLARNYKRAVGVEVSEDGECGATVFSLYRSDSSG